MYIDFVGLCRGGHFLKELMRRGTVIQWSQANITRILGAQIFLESVAFTWVALLFATEGASTLSTQGQLRLVPEFDLYLSRPLEPSLFAFMLPPE